MSFGRRDFIKLASGLLVPYEPKRVYSFPSPNPSPNIVYASKVTFERLVHVGGGAVIAEWEGFIEGSHCYAVKLSSVKPLDRITVDFSVGKR